MARWQFTQAEEHAGKRIPEASLHLCEVRRTYQVMVPVGTYSAVLVRVKCEGRVGSAHTQDTAYYFFAPGVGVIAMITQEDVTAFWIIHIDTSTGKVLTSS